MGPDPISMTVLMSSRFGTALFLRRGLLLDARRRRVLGSWIARLDLEGVWQELLDRRSPVAQRPPEICEAVRDAESDAQAVFLVGGEVVEERHAGGRLVGLLHQRVDGGAAHPLVHVAEIREDQRRNARVFD